MNQYYPVSLPQFKFYHPLPPPSLSFKSKLLREFGHESPALCQLIYSYLFKDYYAILRSIKPFQGSLQIAKHTEYINWNWQDPKLKLLGATLCSSFERPGARDMSETLDALGPEIRSQISFLLSLYLRGTSRLTGAAILTFKQIGCVSRTGCPEHVSGCLISFSLHPSFGQSD